MSDSPGLVDFAIGLVNSVLKLFNRQVKFSWNSNYRRIVINPAHQKTFWEQAKMALELVHYSYSLPEWQAVKPTFFAPYIGNQRPAPLLYPIALYSSELS